jgi:biotin carboxyl carrier protein
MSEPMREPVGDLFVSVDGHRVDPDSGWVLTWVDREAGIARLANGQRSELVVVEGDGAEWHVNLRGRRIAVAVRSRREQLLAEAEVQGRAQGGPVEVRATLPGLVVAIVTEVGSEVDEGTALLTIEAMKMQNEVRAPRPGRVVEVAVEAGRTVATGELLLRLE